MVVIIDSNNNHIIVKKNRKMKVDQSTGTKTAFYANTFIAKWDWNGTETPIMKTLEAFNIANNSKNIYEYAQTNTDTRMLNGYSHTYTITPLHRQTNEQRQHQ